MSIDGAKLDDKAYFMATQNFSYEMFKTLVAPKNKEKGGWWDCDISYLLKRLKEEVAELEQEVTSRGATTDVIKESADVANFAMMVSDLYVRERAREASARYPD
jgi:DNA-binding transcriptional regulator GbsR (MarR family)